MINKSPIIPYCYDGGYKRKIETAAINDTKKRNSELENWRKRWLKCSIYEGGYYEEDKLGTVFLYI